MPLQVGAHTRRLSQQPADRLALPCSASGYRREESRLVARSGLATNYAPAGTGARMSSSTAVMRAP